ncbi:hypothetical protein AB7M43_004396 [Bradyrhizobium elkanii]
MAWRTEIGPIGSDAMGDGEGRLQQFPWRQHPIDQPPALGLGSRERLAGQDQFLGAALADGARQILRAAATWHDAERHFGQREACIGRGVDKVERRRDLAAAAIGRTIDRADHGNRTAQQSAQHALEDQMLCLPGLVRHAVALLQIAPGAERLVAVSGQDHRAQPLDVGREALEQFHQIEAHLGVHRIGRFRPVQRHQQDIAITPFDLDGLEISSH